MRTVLENPTRYHVIQKQKNQVRQYLSESFHQNPNSPHSPHLQLPRPSSQPTKESSQSDKQQILQYLQQDQPMEASESRPSRKDNSMQDYVSAFKMLLMNDSKKK